MNRTGWLVSILAAVAATAAIMAGLGGSGSAQPSVPLGVNANDRNGEVDLYWQASAPQGAATIASYKVFRNGTLLASPTTNTYADTSATNGITYTYAVKAVDSAGSVSAASRPVPATPHNIGTAPFSQGDYGPPDRTYEFGLQCNATTPATNITLPGVGPNGGTNGCYSYFPPSTVVYPHSPVVMFFQGTATNETGCAADTLDQCVQSKQESGTASDYSSFATYVTALRAAGYAVVIAHPSQWVYGNAVPPATCCTSGWTGSPTDQSYVSAVLDQLPSQFSADPNHVYLLGFSAGAHETEAAMCNLGSRLAGVVNESQDVYGDGTLRTTVSNFYPCPGPVSPLPVYFSIGTTDSPTYCGNSPCDPFVLGTNDPTVALSTADEDYSEPHSAASWAWYNGCTNPTSGYATTLQPSGFPSSSDAEYDWTTGCGLSPKTGAVANVRLVVFQGGHTSSYTGLEPNAVAWIEGLY